MHSAIRLMGGWYENSESAFTLGRGEPSARQANNDKKAHPSIVDTTLLNIAYHAVVMHRLHQRVNIRTSAAASSLIVVNVCDRIYNHKRTPHTWHIRMRDSPTPALHVKQH